MSTNTVYLIGAGPGDPELITLKGKRLVDEADVIIYAGSLVNPGVLEGHKADAQIHNSASMTLDEVITVIKDGVAQGKRVVRVHTGDPSIYGAIREQMDRLEGEGIAYEVVPGVSSFTASASVLKKEFTLPDVSQTVICTRLEGRTPVPEKEQLESLAAHQASMAIFLSVQMIDEVAARLMKHYRPDTPIAVVQRATWPDQKVVLGNLSTIADKVSEAGITKTAQILVGDFLGDQYSLSKLYDPSFSHEYRTATK
ncbi:MAG: precorrin-4 C(11)-methyltransferase [Eubacterium aggregans]|uniref:precorrin-4 C(11)-methyltransferase n=1 Tax=Eubacterium aggregans TaxID=81409 RepID=UPI002B1EB375|nr:precorrin-4 C(11)-methyltransferase [Eubacterium aggregans]MEA5074426.1 precorrin-4 C(11)-methyltransferase [Eubacterium aggregans]